MSILGRVSTLIKSNVNDLIDSMQDPGKEIDQMVLDMEDSARQAKTEVAGCMAEEKRMAKQIQVFLDEAKVWADRAGDAVRAGDDALAREALRRQAEIDANRLEIEKALGDQKVYVDQLMAGCKALDLRVKDVKLRQGTLREKARASKNRSPLSNKTAAFEDFDRMSSKIDAVEAEAGLTEELGGRTAAEQEAERKLQGMAEDKSVDDALAALKKKIGG